MAAQPKLELRFGDVSDRDREIVFPGSFEDSEDGFSRCPRVVARPLINSSYSRSSSAKVILPTLWSSLPRFPSSSLSFRLASSRSVVSRLFQILLPLTLKTA